MSKDRKNASLPSGADRLEQTAGELGEALVEGVALIIEIVRVIQYGPGGDAGAT